jgi:RNA polymerase sigma-70 factor (ECF subfamily)
MERKKEQELMERLKEGDKKAFDTIYEAYKMEVEQSLKPKGLGEEDIQDIVQEVFISLWTNRDKLEEINSLKGYLMGAARNKCYSLYRSTQTKTEKHVLYEHNKGILATDVQAKQELSEIVQLQLDRVVNDVERMVFKAAYENEEKPKDIAARFGIQPYKVRRILSKIRRILKKYINR